MAALTRGNYQYFRFSRDEFIQFSGSKPSESLCPVRESKHETVHARSRGQHARSRRTTGPSVGQGIPAPGTCETKALGKDGKPLVGAAMGRSSSSTPACWAVRTSSRRGCALRPGRASAPRIAGLTLSPAHGPEVERVVQIDVGKLQRLTFRGSTTPLLMA